MFPVAQLTPSTLRVTSDLTHQGQDCPAHWALLAQTIPVTSLAGPAELKETYPVALPPKNEQSLIPACCHQ